MNDFRFTANCNMLIAKWRARHLPDYQFNVFLSQSVYSRVARVCKSDRGGPHKFKNRWTTFLKARLNCSVPGSTPFYFNEIQATIGNMVNLQQSDKLIYAVFTTPENSISGSAICAFRLSDLAVAFEEGPFKDQSNPDANWLPLGPSQVPEPRPGICRSNNESLANEQSLHFIQRHPLVDLAIPGHSQAPFFVKTSLGERFTVIAIDSGVKSVNGDEFDVLFVGTSNGRILKVYNMVENRDYFKDEDISRTRFDTLFGRSEKRVKTRPILVESLQVLPYDTPVRNLLVIEAAGENVKKLIVLSDHEVKSVPLHRCKSPAAQSCGDCVGLQDPYCAWDLDQGMCKPHLEVRSSSGLLQQLQTGFHPTCPLDSIIKENGKHLSSFFSTESHFT